MKRRPAPRPPRQARSQESLRRMLDAAEKVLSIHGLQGTTLPRIAAEAGFTAPNVYRRFRDKDALMAAVFQRLTERSSVGTAAEFDPEAVRPLGIVQFSRKVIEGMIGSFRSNAGLSRAAVEYSQQHWEVGFVRKARASESKSFQRMVDTFLMWRDQIRHPDPERAVRFAFLMVAIALRELILFDRAYVFSDVLPVNDDLLKHELPRLFLRCLGVEENTDDRAPNRQNA